MTRNEKIAQAQAKRDDGWTYREIAHSMKVHHKTVQRWLNPDSYEKHLKAKGRYDAKRKPLRNIQPMPYYLLVDY